MKVMKKECVFRGVRFVMEKTDHTGWYFITSCYHRTYVRVVTDNSYAWDWIDDDSDKSKHVNAKRYCYRVTRERWAMLKEEQDAARYDRIHSQS